MGKKTRRSFIVQIASFFNGGIGRAQVTDYLIDVDQKPSWLIKFMYLGEIKTIIRSDIKSKFGIMGF